MRILVICGAGASSTFVAQRVRRAAHAEGLAYSAFAGTERSFPVDVDSADVVLVGPHLADAMDSIRKSAAGRASTVVLLPTDIFTDLDGTRTLALVRDAIGDSATAPLDPHAEDPASTATTGRGLT